MMKKFSFTIIMLITMLFLTSCGEVKMRKSANDYIGQNYELVYKDLHKLGFNDIEKEEIADLTSDGSIPDGSVSMISINGNKDFLQKTIFPKDSKVVLTYNIIRKLSIPVELGSISNKEYTEIAEAFKNAGFTNVHMEEIYDMDPDTTKEKFKNEIRINDKIVLNNSDSFPFDADVNIICHYPYNKYNLKLILLRIGYSASIMSLF